MANFFVVGDRAAIWRLIDGERDREIARCAAAEFEPGESDIAADVDDFLAQLEGTRPLAEALIMASRLRTAAAMALLCGARLLVDACPSPLARDSWPAVRHRHRRRADALPAPRPRCRLGREAAAVRNQMPAAGHGAELDASPAADRSLVVFAVRPPSCANRRSTHFMPGSRSAGKIRRRLAWPWVETLRLGDLGAPTESRLQLQLNETLSINATGRGTDACRAVA